MPVLVRQLGHSSSRRPGAPKGNRNAFKHGRYAAEAIGASITTRGWWLTVRAD